jgi:hypothetical protein
MKMTLDELERRLAGLRYRNAERLGQMADELSKGGSWFLKEMAEGTKRLRWITHRLQLLELRKYSATEADLAAWRRLSDEDAKDLADEANGDWTR